MGKPLAIRTVGMRDGLLMMGDHAVPAGGRHWKATAPAFALLDPRGQPMLWIEGATHNTKVVGEMALTVAKPKYHGRRSPGLVQPRQNRSLRFMEIVRVGGVPVIRTHWSVGENVERTCLEAYDEVLPHSRAEQLARVAELFLMMGV